MSEAGQKWVMCSSCGGNSKKHTVLHEERKKIYDEDFVVGEHVHCLIECCGCESVKYLGYKYDRVSGEEYGSVVFPDGDGSWKRWVSSLDNLDDDEKGCIPKNVTKMHRETVLALNSGIRTLAAGGLRATVEAICLDKKVAAGNLQEKIDALHKGVYLTESQADLLHEERYLGNSALHELETPSYGDLEDALGIVEGMVNAIYVLPLKAQRLRERRETKKK
ncbi:MAG: DUF4145 domain-containing protein [Acidobacteriota bacterium]